MKVAIIYERLQIQIECAATAHERVLNVGRVFGLAHPDSLFEESVAEGVGPNGLRAFQMKTLDEEEPLGIDGAAGPAVRGERIIRSPVVNDFVDGGDKLGTADGRSQCSYQQTVITASLAFGYGPGRVAADFVGHQPLA